MDLEPKGFVAVIIATGKYNDLYPLSLNYPAANLLLSNKRLIMYQLQQIEQIEDVSDVVIVYDLTNRKVKDFIETQFSPNFSSYPHSIHLFQVTDNKPQYQSFRQFINSHQFRDLGSTRGVIILPIDLISTVSYRDVMAMHHQTKTDLTMFLKEKKQYGAGQKKPQIDLEPQIDIALVGKNGEVFAMQCIDDYDMSGFKLSNALCNRMLSGSFYRVFDTELYILSENVVKIVKNLQIPDPISIKNDLVSTLIKNQTNSKLLEYIHKNCKQPLTIRAKLIDPNIYLRKVLNIRIFEQLCLDGLIRNAKQKQVLMPTSYTQPLDEKLMDSFKGSVIGANCLIEPGNKLVRVFICNGCKIGKNVEIGNSIVLENSVVEDNCKILDSIIGPNNIIRSGSFLKSCQSAFGSLIDNKASLDNEIIIPSQ